MVKNAPIIAIEADPNDEEDFDVSEESLERGLADRRARRGRPTGWSRSVTKVSVTLRLDPDVVDQFKAGGRGWQSRMNEALRKAAQL